MTLYLPHRLIVRLFDEDTPTSGVAYFPMVLKKKVKQSRYRPGVAQSVPGI
jgi:hypothetical protein